MALREGWMLVFEVENKDGPNTFCGGTIHTSAECAKRNGASPLEGSRLFGPVKVEFDDEAGWYMYQQ